VQEVDVAPRDRKRVEEALGASAARELASAAGRARSLLGTRTVWNVNSTATGGGAEMLEPLVGYARGLGVDTRRLVIKADRAFFTVTKRLHNHLHGHAGDGEHGQYERVLGENASTLAQA